MISSSTNGLIKRFRKLKQKKYRLLEGVGPLEGLRPVLTAVEKAPHLIDTILLAPELLHSTTARRLLEESAVPLQPITADLFRLISDRDNPTGLAAIIRSPIKPLQELRVSPAGLFIALENLSDPGNLGTILRSADAVGVEGVLLIGGGADLTHPAALKASMGTAFTVPVAAVTQLNELKMWRDHHQIAFVGSSARGSLDFWAYRRDFDRPAALLIGNEQAGLSAELAEMAEGSLRIPMWGQASSLNAATAATLLLYELRRQEQLSDHQHRDR